MIRYIFTRLQATALFVVCGLLIVSVYSYNEETMSVAGVWPSPGIVYKGENGTALTFTVELGDESVEWLLDELERQAITKATFFLEPSWVERQPELVERLRETGYDIGLLHLYPEHFDSFTKKESQQYIQQLQNIFDDAGLHLSFYRADEGLPSVEAIQLLRDEKIIAVDHSLHWEDVRSANPAPSYRGAVIEVPVPNRLQGFKGEFETWLRTSKENATFEPVTLLELMASADKKIRLLE